MIMILWNGTHLTLNITCNLYIFKSKICHSVSFHRSSLQAYTWTTIEINSHIYSEDIHHAQQIYITSYNVFAKKTIKFRKTKLFTQIVRNKKHNILFKLNCNTTNRFLSCNHVGMTLFTGHILNRKCYKNAH